MKKIILLFLLFISINSFAQLNYQPVNAVNAAGTFTSIGTNGSAISTANTDDANSTLQLIGFTFNYNGLNFTQFIFNTNGFIKLGSVAPNSAAIFGTSAQDATGSILLMSAANYPANSNSIAAFNMDLQGTGSTEYRVFTSGSAPNRVCTIEWKNVQEKTTTPALQFSSINFQIKLYESTNVIEIVFANFVATVNTDAFKTASTGLLGTDITTATNVLYVRKGSTQAWTGAIFENEGNIQANGQIFNVRNTVLPDNGRTFRFFPTYVNDLSVIRVETFGKIPMAYGFPHAIKALIKNTGTNTMAAGKVVSLSVTGANIFADTKLTSALAAGASELITFAPAGAFLAGNNTVAVSLPSDDNTSNNSATMTQLVNGTAFSYADNSAVTLSLGYDLGSGIIATKHSVQGIAFVTNVKVFIANNAPTTGNTVYAVVMNAAGTIVAQSANYVVQASDINAFKNFTITTPPSFTSADFFVGLAQTANASVPAVGYFPVGIQAEASPTRLGAYYTAALAGGAPAEATTNGRFVIEALLSSTSTSMPLSLTSFNGKLVNAIAQLNWTTNNEVNTDKFEVERTASTNINWTKILTIDAAGNSSTSKNYVATDAGLSSGKWMYRLKMMDKDGSFTYSNIVALEVNAKGQFVLNQNYPNPVKGNTQLSYQLNKDAKVMIELLGVDGKKIATLVNQIQTMGTYNFTIGCKKYVLAAGNYNYRMVVVDKNNQELFNASRTMIVLQ